MMCAGLGIVCSPGLPVRRCASCRAGYAARRSPWVLQQSSAARPPTRPLKMLVRALSCSACLCLIAPLSRRACQRQSPNPVAWAIRRVAAVQCTVRGMHLCVCTSQAQIAPSSSPIACRHDAAARRVIQRPQLATGNALVDCPVHESSSLPCAPTFHDPDEGTDQPRRARARSSSPPWRTTSYAADRMFRQVHPLLVGCGACLDTECALVPEHRLRHEYAPQRTARGIPQSLHNHRIRHIVGKVKSLSMKRKATLHWCSMRFSRFPHLKNHWQTKKASMVASALQTSNTRCGQCHYGYRQRTGVEKCALSVHTSAAYVLAARSSPNQLSRLLSIVHCWCLQECDEEATQSDTCRSLWSRCMRHRSGFPRVRSFQSCCRFRCRSSAALRFQCSCSRYAASLASRGSPQQPVGGAYSCPAVSPF